MTNTPEPGEIVSPAPAVPEPRPGLGKVALRAAIVLAIASIIASVVLGIAGAPFVDRSGPVPSFSFNTRDENPSTALLGLLSPLHALLGTLVGAWIIVQSIVAISTNRGRRAAIVALVVAVLVPGVSLAVYLLIMLSPR